jgi:hypothetical protein
MRFLGPTASDLKGLLDGLASRAVHLKVSIAHAKREKVATTSPQGQFFPEIAAPALLVVWDVRAAHIVDQKAHPLKPR